MEWETVIGLEIHAQLATKSKIFSSADTSFGAEANTQACAVDLGFPGVLPVINEEAVHMAVKFGLAVDAEIADHSVFARKNYFYPDLPKGYQISQFEKPIVGPGHITIKVSNENEKKIGVTRAHLEEDAGKSLHKDYDGFTGIDLNRAGTPLLEIVSEPDMRSAAEAIAYMKKIHAIVRYIEICDGNMQEGSFRCDANVSVRRLGADKLGTRAEIKNLNSFRFIEKAINHEVERQIDILESGGSIVQETRLYDSERDETRSMRSKEEANDYRYFPDPDLLPLVVTEELKSDIAAKLPELPDERKQRFENDFKLTAYDSDLITSDKNIADYFENVLSFGADPKISANWVNGELSAALNKDGLTISQSPITEEQLALLIERIKDKTISGKIAKQIFSALWLNEAQSVDEMIEAKGLRQMNDEGELESLVANVIQSNPNQVEQYKSGKTKILGFFVGQIMKSTGGKANPAQLNEMLKRQLDSI